MLDLDQVRAALTRCGLSYAYSIGGFAVFVTNVWTESVEPIMIYLNEVDARISEQRLSDAVEAQGIPLAVIQDALLQTRQNPP